ncbi:head-tail adaptor protein [Paenibacillus larvae]|nr:head-tail adaptor protein [Paenibacillus larvae]MDT2306340.1 head-tail adaptor protein [Paenibacillus larvae]
MDDRTLHKLKQSLQTMILAIEGSVCNMNPGKLNKRITIKKPSPNPDGVGGYDDGLADVATIWANIRPPRGREYWQSQQTPSRSHTLYHDPL